VASARLSHRWSERQGGPLTAAGWPSPRVCPGRSVGRWPFAVSAAAGGVGSISVRLARRAEAKAIGIARPADPDWLTAQGVKAVAYGEGLAIRLREDGINAFIDTHGGGYVKLAIEFSVARDCINTIIDFTAVQE